MVLKKIGETTTEVLVNGTSQYGPNSQSSDSSYDVSVSDGSVTNSRDFRGRVEMAPDSTETIWENYDGGGTLNGVSWQQEGADEMRIVLMSDYDIEPSVTVYDNDGYVDGVWEPSYSTSHDSGWLTVDESNNGQYFSSLKITERSSSKNDVDYLLKFKYYNQKSGFNVDGVTKS